MAIATPVLEQTLYTKILDALNAAFDENSNSNIVKQNFAKSMASAIANGMDAWIKTAQVAPGIPVATAGSPTAQTGATTGPGVIV
jgi:chitinase